MITVKNFKNEKEWLKARKNKIGGSDCAAILGMNPYKTNVDLWKEKKGIKEAEDISDKPFVIYGKRAEPLLRELFKLDFPRYEVNYSENNIWLNSKYPFAHASLDGWITDKETNEKGILEIKTTQIMKSQSKEKWKNQIPQNYYLQVLHYLLITEFDFVILKAQLKYEYTESDKTFLNTNHYFIKRKDVEEDIEYLRDKEEKFYQSLIDDKCPDLLLPEI